MNPSFVVSCVVSSVFLVPGQDDAGSRARDQAIDTCVREAMERDHVPGLSVAVVENGRVAVAEGYGLADVELNVPATADTVYELLSVAKQFTATGILILAKERKLELDDAVAKHLSFVPDAWREVTLRHLLSHTSGIRDYTDLAGFWDSIRLDRTPEEILKPVVESPLAFKPGERWAYSNSNYYLLGLVIEKASGKSYAEFLAEKIFKPLDMSSTRVDDKRDIVPQRASGYHWTKAGLRNADYVSPTQKWAAGAVLSTAADLAKWEQALAQGKLLGPELLQQMWTPASLPGGEHAPYGLGNELSDDHGHRVAGHQGGGLAFNVTDLRLVDDHLSVIVLCNLTQAPSRSIAHRIAALYLPALSDDSNAGIEDASPETTNLLQGVLLDAAQGKCDPTMFAAGVADKMVPFIQKTGPGFLGRRGKLNSFTLLEDKAVGPKRMLRYRARFDSSSLVWTFALDANGKILEMEPSEE